MRTVTIKREPSHDWGTAGFLQTDGFDCRTLELPWKMNVKKMSCIEPGSYICRLTKSPKFGKVYELQNVRGRGDVLIHSGNHAGDIGKGLKSDSMGCILVGKRITVVNGQMGVETSKNTLVDFMNIMNGEDFVLNIENIR